MTGFSFPLAFSRSPFLCVVISCRIILGCFLGQFFLGDYRPMIQDTHGNFLDQVCHCMIQFMRYWNLSVVLIYKS